MCLIDLKLATITRSALSILHFIKKGQNQCTLAHIYSSFIPSLMYEGALCTVCCISNQNQLEAI